MKAQDFRDYRLLLVEHAEQIFAMTDDVGERAHKSAELRPAHQRNIGTAAPQEQKLRTRCSE
jgi:hypothetical protein